MTDLDFIQKHLDGVSRSFALAIKGLQTPLRLEIGTAYLLFRVLDSIEDARWDSSSLRNQAFNRFFRLLRGAPSDANDFHLLIKEGISDAEKDLLAEFPRLLEILGSLSPSKQNLLHAKLATMAFGMKSYPLHGQLRLNSIEELDRYCYFVAGIVGELLTEILARSSGPVSPKLYQNSVDFGLFLQKVNILKDQHEDESSGRFFVPSRESIFKSLIGHAEKSFHYLLSIPKTRTDYLVFCAFSFFLGLASLPYIEAAHRTKTFVKPPREITLMLYQQIEKLALDDGALESLYKKLVTELKWVPGLDSPPSPA